MVVYLNTTINCHATCDNIKEAVILQHLAQTQHSIMNGNCIEAYVNSNIALCLLEKDEEPPLDLLYITLFEQVIACDQAGFFGRRDDALDMLKTLTETIEYNDSDLGQSLIESLEGYKDLAALAAFCPSSETQHKLKNIAASLFLNNTYNGITKLPQDNSYQCKKFWKRSFSWWKKQIKKALKEIVEWIEIAHEAKKIYDEHEHLSKQMVQ